MSVGLTNGQGVRKYGVDATTGLSNKAIIDAIFKEFYLPGMRELLNNKRILSRTIGQSSEGVEGRYAVMSLNTGRNHGIGHIAEGGKLPDPGRQQYNRATYSTKYGYGRILFTGPSMGSSRTDRGSFINVLDGEMRGLARDVQVDVNRILFGDGSGRLARIASVAGAGATSVYTVDLPGGFTSNQGPGTQYLAPGMRVSFVNAAGASLAFRAAAVSGNHLAYKILAVDPANSTITIENPASLGAAMEITAAAAGDYVVRASEQTTTVTRDDTSFKNEPFGLAALVDDGNPFGGTAGETNYVGGIDATSNPWWQAYVIDNLGTPRPFTPDLLQQLQDGIDISGDGVVELYMTTHGIRRAYVNQMIQAKRFINTMTFDGGFKAIEYEGRPIVVDKDCTRGRIYGLDTSVMKQLMEADWQWLDSDGSVLDRMPNHDAYQACLFRYWELGTDARNRQGVVLDILDV